MSWSHSPNYCRVIVQECAPSGDLVQTRSYTRLEQTDLKLVKRLLDRLLPEDLSDKKNRYDY